MRGSTPLSAASTTTAWRRSPTPDAPTSRASGISADLPTSTLVPKSIATKSVRGEQKTFDINKRRYPVNSTPLKETTQVEAIVEITRNVTRGSVGGGEDLLDPNPVVDILEVSQGATIFQEGVEWQQSGNHVDWLGSGNDRHRYHLHGALDLHQAMVKGTDYVDSGWFGQANQSGGRKLLLSGDRLQRHRRDWPSTPLRSLPGPPPPGR